MPTNLTNQLLIIFIIYFISTVMIFFLVWKKQSRLTKLLPKKSQKELDKEIDRINIKFSRAYIQNNGTGAEIIAVKKEPEIEYKDTTNSLPLVLEQDQGNFQYQPIIFGYQEYQGNNVDSDLTAVNNNVNTFIEVNHDNYHNSHSNHSDNNYHSLSSHSHDTSNHYSDHSSSSYDTSSNYDNSSSSYDSGSSYGSDY